MPGCIVVVVSKTLMSPLLIVCAFDQWGSSILESDTESLDADVEDNTSLVLPSAFDWEKMDDFAAGAELTASV